MDDLCVYCTQRVSLPLLQHNEGALGFSVSWFRPFFRSVFQFLCQKRLRFFGFGDHWGLGFLFSVPGKNNIGFSDLPLDAVRCFPGFSPENMRFNNLNRRHVFSDFFRVFGFDRNLFRFCGFLLLLYDFSLRSL